MFNKVEGSKNLIEGFIEDYVIGHRLDQRTEKAYRMDLELFYMWVDGYTSSNVYAETNSQTKMDHQMESFSQETTCEEWMEAYLDYLRTEKNLSFSTVYRKNRVFGYYLSYLVRQGVIANCRPLKPIEDRDKKSRKEHLPKSMLSRKDADAFFQAMKREYAGLESEFRRRICLRDLVMMELLFYHKIEISELLRAEVSDYDKREGILRIQKKREDSCYIRVYSQELLKMMEMWLEERKAFQCDRESSKWLFLSKYGKLLSMEMFIQIFDKYRKLAGIEKKLTPKDLKESSMKSYARELMVERCS